MAIPNPPMLPAAPVVFDDLALQYPHAYAVGTLQVAAELAIRDGSTARLQEALDLVARLMVESGAHNG